VVDKTLEIGVLEFVGIAADGLDVVFVEPSLERTLLSSERDSLKPKLHILY